MKMDSLNLLSRAEEVEEEEDCDEEQEQAQHPFSKSHPRKSNKPIMEKRRRARINSCLTDLKGILLEAMRKDPARHSKLEKADILELTVRHLQNIQRNQLAVAMATDPTVLYRFKNGFSECASEVSRYLSKLDGVETGMKHRVSSHLTSCVNGLQGVNPVVGYGSGAGGYGQRKGMGQGDLSHLIPFSPPPLPTTLLTPTHPDDDVNNNRPLEALMMAPLSAFQAIPPELDLVGPSAKRRLIDADPLDYSLAKNNVNRINNNNNNNTNHGDGEGRVVRIVKVEPTMQVPTRCVGNPPPKDSMWRPW